MDLLLQRHEGRTATPGELFIDGAFECFTLEDPVRERSGVPVSMWKIPGKTAIGAGRYRVTLEDSPRFGPDTLTIHGVEGFTGVRMHGGNTAADTEGCPLLGDRLAGETIAAGTSRPAVARVKAVVRQAIDAGYEVWIEIRNPELSA